MEVAFGALVHDDPAEVRQAELEGAPDAGKLRVVDEHDPALLQQPPRVDQVEEHALEPVVAVEEGEVEAPAVGEQARQDDLRLLAVELDEVANACLLEDLEPRADERRPVAR